MELGLSLGDASKPFGFLSKDTEVVKSTNNNTLGFCMALGITSNGRQEQDTEKTHHHQSERNGDQTVSVDQPPLQLNLLPLSPVPRRTPSHQHAFPWPSDNGSSDGGSSGNGARGFDVNRTPPPAEVEEGAALSSPNSVASSFQMDFCIYRGGGGDGGGNKRDSSEMAGNDAVEVERACGRGGSDEDENGLARKKLRLSKEQSAYLEESFKEHNTLNPKQKLALAKQLNLRPRQVEVWFQNRRARTKLKQTEVDCEYLKRCCETLTEENRRLQKELQELRALKTSNPFYMQLPATTLTMCPSCERVATTTTTTATTKTTEPTSKTTAFPLSRPRFYPFSHTPPNPHQSTTS